MLFLHVQYKLLGLFHISLDPLFIWTILQCLQLLFSQETKAWRWPFLLTAFPAVGFISVNGDSSFFCCSSKQLESHPCLFTLSDTFTPSANHIGSTIIRYLESNDFSPLLLRPWSKSASTLTWMIGVASCLVSLSHPNSPYILFSEKFSKICQVLSLLCSKPGPGSPLPL